MVGLLLVLILSPSLPCAADSHEKTWGLGYDKFYSYSSGGLTVRRWLGPVWELGLTAAPDDVRSESYSHYWDTEFPLDEGNVEDPDDYTRESGWVTFIVGRRMFRQDKLGLMLDLGLRYWWSDSRRDNRRYDESSETTRTSTEMVFTDNWTLSLDMRPVFDLMDRISIEARFGLMYRWSDERMSWHQRYTQSYDTIDSYSRHTDSSQSFQSYGWSGMGDFSFIVWF